MPVDLTPNGQYTALRSTIADLTAERERLRVQVDVLPGLYDEIHEREDEITELRGKVARLESRGITDISVTLDRYEFALEKIVANGGRGGLRIAAEALES